MDDKTHWEGVYRVSSPASLSWYQPTAARSLALIRRVAPDLHAPIIDVGGGTSLLVDELIGLGYGDVSVLDIAGNALAMARGRLGAAAPGVHWIEADARTAALPAAHYAVWHDRAVFHFLTNAADRERYVAQVTRAVRRGGFVLVATFGEHGPTRCSGLPVARYSPDALHHEFGPAFALVSAEEETHHTPAGTRQEFVYCLCRWEGAR